MTQSVGSGLIDTHTHLGDSVFDEDRAEVIKRAHDVGIDRIVIVGETFADAEKIMRLTNIHPEIIPAAGLYPTYLSLDDADKMIGFIQDHRSRLGAIGEVGLDHWKVKGDDERAVQAEIFSRFITLATELDLPLNIHSRSAGRKVIEMLLSQDAGKVQLHAFDAKASTALPAVEAGYLFSIPPSIVRSRQKQKLVKQLPLTCLLVETDSPVLGPDPQERNEPANAIIALEAIAEIKDTSVEQVRESVVENQSRLYG